jgi:hypothetical protein
MSRETGTGVVCDNWEAQTAQMLLRSLNNRGERGVLLVDTWHWGTSDRFITTTYHKDAADVPPMAGGCCAFYLTGADFQHYLTMPPDKLAAIITEAIAD